MDPQTHTSNRISKKVRESFKYNLVPGTNRISSVTDSLSESVNTVCSTMDLIRTAFRLSGHTVTSFSILSLSSHSQKSGKREGKKVLTHLLRYITHGWKM